MLALSEMDSTEARTALKYAAPAAGQAQRPLQSRQRVMHGDDTSLAIRTLNSPFEEPLAAGIVSRNTISETPTGRRASSFGRSRASRAAARSRRMPLHDPVVCKRATMLRGSKARSPRSTVTLLGEIGVLASRVGA